MEPSGAKRAGGGGPARMKLDQAARDFSARLRGRRVAVVHDWLNGMRGGELVLENILRLLPAESTEIFTLIKEENRLSDYLRSFPIRSSFIQKLPLARRKYRSYLPLFPTAIEQFEFRDFDLVLSTSHCVAKGVIVPPDVPHIAYIHSPMRYIWDLYPDYFPLDQLGFISRRLIPLFSNYLRMWDTASSSRADLFLANSQYIAGRIERFFGRAAGVVHPPCGTAADLEEAWSQSRGKWEGQAGTHPKDFYLIVSAFAPYKRIDLAVEAFRQSGRELVIVGHGQQEKKIRALAKGAGNIHLTGSLDREKTLALMKEARGFIFPGIEDFGIAPVEAQARCLPVLAYGRGGALETVVAGQTGHFFKEQTVSALEAGLEEIATTDWKGRLESFRQNVARFSDEMFRGRYAAQILPFLDKNRDRFRL